MMAPLAGLDHTFGCFVLHPGVYTPGYMMAPLSGLKK
jgi:hypothetical protein